MKQLTPCPIEQLKPLVRDELDDDARDAIIVHLDECEECRSRLEKAAGSADDWSLASEAFADDEIDLSAEYVDALDTNTTPSVGYENYDHESLLRHLGPCDDPRAAGRIGPFEITGVVGSGGMGIVLKARDPALDRYVAIKMLAPHLASSKSARKRFAREARAAAAVIHDNVIAIYQVAHWNDLPYLVMPYLPDPSLQQRIEQEGGLDLEGTLSVGLQVARGLSAAHTQGLVHRDVKPANVLLSQGTERAVITDFGLARASDDASLTRAGMLTGTPHYMSPEQARGENVDQSSDLFSLGSVLFAMVTGEAPVPSELGSETIEQIAKGRLPSLSNIAPGTPSWLVRLVAWLHEPQPKRRPESAEKVADLLEQCLAHHRQPNQTPLPEVLVSENRSQVWRRWLVGGVVGASAIALLLGAFALWSPEGTGGASGTLDGVGSAVRTTDGNSELDRETKVRTANPTFSQHELDWNAVEEELESITKDLDETEARTSKLWGELTTGANDE